MKEWKEQQEGSERCEREIREGLTRKHGRKKKIQPYEQELEI